MQVQHCIEQQPSTRGGLEQGACASIPSLYVWKANSTSDFSDLVEV